MANISFKCAKIDDFIYVLYHVITKSVFLLNSVDICGEIPVSVSKCCLQHVPTETDWNGR